MEGYRLFGEDSPRRQGAGGLPFVWQNSWTALSPALAQMMLARVSKVREKRASQRKLVNVQGLPLLSSRATHSYKQQVKQKCQEVCTDDTNSYTKRKHPEACGREPVRHCSSMQGQGFESPNPIGMESSEGCQRQQEGFP